MAKKKKTETDEEVLELKATLDNAGKFKPIKSPIEFKIFKDKAGKKLSLKEYMARWKDGIEGITPTQQLNVQLKSTFLMLIGIIAGFIITLVDVKTFWWLTLILGGAFGNTIVQYIGLRQKKKMLIKLDEAPEMTLDEALK